ncbi:hypothetical protein [Streptomyces sp. NPDC005303]|uniref:hypothetical protein n=1 Tax=Streptomyces sp. NPDC005303 TaxID=3155713 RepID=UPI00339E29B0
MSQGADDGTLSIGWRTPIDGMPAWVTPKVARGGFATGAASAGGPLQPYEGEAARRARVTVARKALFAHYLTDAGLAELTALLADGGYQVTVPEEAALLTVAWLAGHGDAAGALRLVDELAPWVARLRFAPPPGPVREPAADDWAVYRLTVGEAHAAVAGRRPDPAVEAMREALAVWNPFADELLAHWLETAGDGRVLAHAPDADWRARGAALLKQYRRLAEEHRWCGKHRRPKENLAILRTAMEEAVAGRELDARRKGLLQHAVEAIVRRRGRPGTVEHAALRARQAADAARPTHHALARLVVRRMSGLPQDSGTPQADRLIGPVTAQEHTAPVCPRARKCRRRSPASSEGRSPRRSARSSNGAWCPQPKSWPNWFPNSRRPPSPWPTPMRNCAA